MSTLAELEAREHFVYRAFDSAGRLLYVGCSLNVQQRMRDHRYWGSWYRLMVRHEVDGPYPYAEARAIEWEAIQTEDPIHNAQTPRAVADRSRRRKFYASVMDAAIAHGEHWTVACHQALVATAIEFAEDEVA